MVYCAFRLHRSKLCKSLILYWRDIAVGREDQTGFLLVSPRVVRQKKFFEMPAPGRILYAPEQILCPSQISSGVGVMVHYGIPIVYLYDCIQSFSGRVLAELTGHQCIVGYLCLIPALTAIPTQMVVSLFINNCSKQ